MTDIRHLQQLIGATNEANGWHDRYRHVTSLAHGPARTDHIVAKLALITTEVAEAIEDVRDRRTVTTIRDDGKPEGLPSELADIVIRTLDLAYMLGIDLSQEIDQKVTYNATRGHMHGGKAI